MRKILGIALSFLLLVLTFAGSVNRNPSITELSVAVSCGDHYGCGTIFDSTDSALIVVTALHILEDLTADQTKDISVTFYDDEEYNASILKSDRHLDLAFLEVPKNSMQKQYDTILGNAARLKTSPAAGDKIYFVDANEKKVYSGSIASPSVYSEDLGLDTIYCFCQVSPGMSGTGLFDEEGRYLGILLGGSDNAEAVCLYSAVVAFYYYN